MEDFLWGVWNGLTCWIVLVAHIFDQWPQYPFYNVLRSGNLYDFGFALGAASTPIAISFGGWRGFHWHHY